MYMFFSILREATLDCPHYIQMRSLLIQSIPLVRFSLQFPSESESNPEADREAIPVIYSSDYYIR